ncbi:hypothetical protein [Thalassomonas actiniarum]|uniref:Uncharacterized protein n=1 Tax=Thalassomonas actiniarum TaxID=485447 RepID=A0AAE9YMA3_9GAMM|nr:hypothetical protein [Thalassomonas actiniarum]WDD97880.1 hypothetical protein SG35_021690 [Thalassomonas actiniarum]
MSQNNSNSTVTINLGFIQFTIPGRKFLMISGPIFLLLMSYLIWQAKIDQSFNEYFYPERSEQYNKFHELHPIIEELANRWNKVSNLNGYKTSNVRYIRDHIHDALPPYKNLALDKVNLVTQIAWNWHLARIFIILADMESNYSHIEKAFLHLKKAEELSTKSQQLAQKELKQLKDISIHKMILRERINAYAIGYFIKKEQQDFLLAKKHLKSLGGCDVLTNERFFHKKIANVINCPYLELTQPENNEVRTE